MNHLKSCAVAVVALLATFVIGCNKNSTASSSSSSGNNGRVKLGFLVKQPDETWFQLEWKFAQEAADKYGFDLVKLPAQDGEKVLSAIDNLAAQQAQGFVICTPDVRLGSSIAGSAKEKGLKLIAVDDRFVDDSGKPMEDVHYLGISARKIGNMVGQALYDEMKKRNWPIEETALCVVTFDELDTARERTEGEIETITAAGFPKDKIFKAPQKTTDVPGGLDATNAVLAQHSNVKYWLVTGMNDSAVMGAVRATEQAQIAPDHVIGIGINGTDCLAEFKNPKPTGFYASVLLSARDHGYKTAEMLYKWVKDGTEPPKDTRTTGVLINRENYQQVLKEQGISG
jgi:L-arabinose transport system substrate-binding protein